MRLKEFRRTAKRALSGNSRFLRPASILPDRPNIDIVGPNPNTRSKTNIVSQWCMSLVGFRSPSVSGTFGSIHQMSFDTFFIHSFRPRNRVRVIRLPKLLPPKWICDLQNNAPPSSGQWLKQALQRNCVGD